MMKPIEMLGKMAGKVKKAAAAITGDRGILLRLKEEHTQVSMLMERILIAPDSDTRVRRQLFPKIRTELLAHAHAEQETFYTTLQVKHETAERIPHAAEEHREIENLIERLYGMDMGAPEWIGLFRELVDRVKHHVHEEEHKLMPKAREALSDAELEALEKRFVARRQEEKAILEPALPV